MSSLLSDQEIEFYGNRNHVLAVSLLEYTLNKILNKDKLEKFSNIFVRRYKQLREVNSPVRIQKASNAMPKDALCASLEIEVPENKSYRYEIISVPGEIGRRRDILYCQTHYNELRKNKSTATIPNVVDFWHVLHEAVQLTKVFHISKYNDKHTYRFVVGGFEKLNCMVLDENEVCEISCQIIRHVLYEDTIYNYTKITIEGGFGKNIFYMPFIGKEITE